MIHGKAYPTLKGDRVTPCPVCTKQVVLQVLPGNVVEILFHNDQRGSPCNGTGKKAKYFPNRIQEVR